MLAKFTNVSFAVITCLLVVLLIGSVIKINNLDKEVRTLTKEKNDVQVVVAEQTIKLNEKTVEVVHVPSVRYEEKIIQAKPIIEYVTKETFKIVDNPIYLNVCFSDDGVRATNTLIELGHTNDTGAASEPSI